MSAPSRYSIVSLLLISLFLVGGCATPGVAIVPLGELAPAPLPRYQVGDRVVYDNNHWEEVVATKGDSVSWRRDSGTEYTASRDFVLPYLDRQSGFKASRWETEVTADDLWPLRSGEHKLVYRSYRYEESLVADASAPSEPRPVDIVCKSAGTARVSVAGGEFDTYRVVCDRFRFARGWQRYREWYYAPSVGHYVLRVDYSSQGGFRNSLELVAFLPAMPSASDQWREGADRHLQQVLGNTASGTAVASEHGGDAKLRLVTTPLNTLRSRDGVYCRNFSQVLGSGSAARSRYGIACLEAGVWRIPGNG